MIEIKNVSFHYTKDDSNNGVNDINLTIKDGEVLLLCGKSGCGKTTITRIVNGLIPHYYEGDLQGEVLLDGENITLLPLHETAKKVGSVFQNPRTQFFTVDSTSEMAFCCENQGLPKDEIIDRIKEVATNLDMKSLLGKNLFALSGGEKQKIACAAVATAKPNIIILDEPSSNLDIHAISDLRKLIAFWKKQGKTIIIAEHRLYYLCGLLDRIVYLKDGNICKEFSEHDLRQFSMNEIETMGLRPLDVRSLEYTNKNISFEKELQFKDFIFSYPYKDICLNIKDLTLPKNKIIGIIGHNGGGKSTFARCVCGTFKKCNGIVEDDGKRYNRKQRLKKCYMVMQDVGHQLFTESVFDEVLISMKNQDENIVSKILDELNLSDFKDKHPMALSGGQKQRVAIASALVSDRDIIIFDEPTSGLDLLHMREVAKKLIYLQKQGKSVFIITHDIELILSCCSHILHLEQGEVYASYPLDKNGHEDIVKFFTE